MATQDLTSVSDVPLSSANTVLLCYAPFGNDQTLSLYRGVNQNNVRINSPDQALRDHPLFLNLQRIAQQTQVAVEALVQLKLPIGGFDSLHTFRVSLGPGRHEVLAPMVPNPDLAELGALRDFLSQASGLHGNKQLVLSLQGHGAGFYPDLTAARTAPPNGGIWKYNTHDSLTALDDSGKPALPMGAPLLTPDVPAPEHKQEILSTLALSEALKQGLPQDRKLAVLHMDSCFNMCLELLDAVQNSAHFAVGYLNYNFFTAGVALLEAMRNLSSASQLARALALQNAHQLAGMPQRHPSVAGAVKLSRVQGVVDHLQALAQALCGELNPQDQRGRPDAKARRSAVDTMRKALASAQRYDSMGRFELSADDELIDLASLAEAFTGYRSNSPGSNAVRSAASDLLLSLDAIRVYGTKGTPWMDQSVRWDFSSVRLCMNIFCPDPMRTGYWDWRSPWYLAAAATTAPWAAQAPTIPMLQANSWWLRFIAEYHRDLPFNGLRTQRLPPFPVLRV